MVFPTASSTGLAASTSAASPPTMIDRLASTAPGSPPLTGACRAQRRQLQTGFARSYAPSRWPTS
jgi:hypothetical protein